MFESFQDAMYNSKCSSGYLYANLKNRKRKEVKQNQIFAEILVEDVSNYLTEAEKQKYLLYFKMCVLPKEIDLLKEIMRKTIEYRKELIGANNQEIQEIFPFYFTTPELVLFDFGIRFKNANGNSFVEKWPDMQKKLENLMDFSFAPFAGCDDDVINAFAFLLKLLPAVRSNFGKSLKHLMVFEKVYFFYKYMY